MTAPLSPKPAAILFDFDGVLVNSEPLHHRAFADVLRPLGIDLTWEAYIAEYLGYDDPGLFAAVFPKFGRPQPAIPLADLVADKNRRYEAALDHSDPLLDGAPAFIRRVATTRPCAVVSMADRKHIEQILDRAGLRSCFATIVAADAVTAPKPDPQGYRLGLTRLQAVRPGLHAADCLVIEDSLPGIQAAKAAGIKVLAVTTTHPAAQLAAADRVASGLAAVTDADLAALFA